MTYRVAQVPDGKEAIVGAGSVGTYWTGLGVRVRAWWDASTFLGDVALVFAIVTVGNSIMMLTGLDEPKTGAFAYVHLLGRFGIIVVLVGLFYLDEARERFSRWWHQIRRQPRREGARHTEGTVLEGALRSVIRGGIDGTARVFTALVVGTCVVALALSPIRPPDGGSGLYRNLVLLAVVLLPVMIVASRRWKRRAAARRGLPQ